MRSNSIGSRWIYRRVSHPMGIEASDWYGQHSPTLSAHFHEEPQVSIVFSGHRYFEIGEHRVHIGPGSFAIIPAGMPHRSIGASIGKTASKDIFLDTNQLPGECASRIVLGSVNRFARRDADSLVDEVLECLANHNVVDIDLLEPDVPREVAHALRSSQLSVAEIARRTGYSRAGFIRKFAREIGMTPHAYRIAHRVSQARRLLRSNTPPAAVAYECGFADQSHLGRVFRKSFGTTPAAFRRVWRG